jgi:hypothetical protein
MGACSRGIGSAIRTYSSTAEDHVLKEQTAIVRLHFPLVAPELECEEQADPAFARSVVILTDQAWIFLLDDETFLLVNDESGVILRLRPDLTTGSPLVPDRLLLLEPSEVSGISRQQPDFPGFYGRLEQLFLSDLGD